MKKNVVALGLISLVLVAVCFPTISVSNPDNNKGAKYKPSLYFKKLQEEAIAINAEFCNALGTPVSSNLQRQRVVDFATSAKEIVVEKFPSKTFKPLQDQFEYFVSQVGGGKIHPLSMPVFKVDNPLGPGENVRYYFNGNQGNAGVIDDNVNNECGEEFNGKSCTEVLKDLSEAIFPYQQQYNALKAKKTMEMLDDLSKRWDDYLDDGRAMTTLDLLVTTYLEKSHMQKNTLVEPPKHKWFLLHPDLVMEYVDKAPDGERLQPGLSIDWFGVYCMDNKCFLLPSGISLISILSDRVDVADVGYGLSLHFGGQYSMGWVRRGRDNGFFLSINLLTHIKNVKNN